MAVSAERLSRLRERLQQPLLVTTPANVRWLTGLDSSNAAVLVEPDDVTLYADFRYAPAARQVDGARFVETKRSLLSDLAGRLTGQIGFEASHVTYAGWQSLDGGEAELVPTYDAVEEHRAVKSADELDAIRRAQAIADAALAELLNEPWLGRTDRELAFRLEQLMILGGAEGASFGSIVGPGPLGANPHGRPNGTVLEKGTLVVVDWGCIVDGYCSDCTRTFSTGELPDELERIYDVCLAAEERAVEGIKAGMSGVDADLLARQPIEDDGYGAQFGHGLGHGVGLLVHEAPRLSRESTDVLRPGNVVTIEPGIYLEGNAGVRIEDLARAHRGRRRCVLLAAEGAAHTVVRRRDRRRPLYAAVLAVTLVAACGSAASARDAAVQAACAPRASAAYTARTLTLLRSGQDVLGNRLLRAPGGPTYAAARRALPPLFLARGRRRPADRLGRLLRAVRAAPRRARRRLGRAPRGRRQPDPREHRPRAKAHRLGRRRPLRRMPRPPGDAWAGRGLAADPRDELSRRLGPVVPPGVVQHPAVAGPADELRQGDPRRRGFGAGADRRAGAHDRDDARAGGEPLRRLAAHRVGRPHRRGGVLGRARCASCSTGSGV